MGILGAAQEDSTLYKTYTNERAWSATGDRLQELSYLNSVNHYRKFTTGRQSTDIGKYTFVNRSITDRNKLPEHFPKNGSSNSKILWFSSIINLFVFNVFWVKYHICILVLIFNYHTTIILTNSCNTISLKKKALAIVHSNCSKLRLNMSLELCWSM